MLVTTAAVGVAGAATDATGVGVGVGGAGGGATAASETTAGGDTGTGTSGETVSGAAAGEITVLGVVGGDELFAGMGKVVGEAQTASSVLLTPSSSIDFRLFLGGAGSSTASS